MNTQLEFQNLNDSYNKVKKDNAKNFTQVQKVAESELGCAEGRVNAHTTGTRKQIHCILQKVISKSGTLMADMVDHSQTEDDVNAVRHDLVYEKQQLDGEIINRSEKSVKRLSR